jgi:DNA-binding transcriptional LysR family regulator
MPATLKAIRLQAMPVWVALPPDHRLADKELIDLSDLVDEDFIMLDTEPGATHAFSMFNAAGLTPKVAFRTPSFELTRSLVGRGLGYTIQIQRPIGDQTYEGRPIVVRPLNTPLRREYITIAWSRRNRPSARSRAVIDAARASWPDPDARLPQVLIDLDASRVSE